MQRFARSYGMSSHSYLQRLHHVGLFFLLIFIVFRCHATVYKDYTGYSLLSVRLESTDELDALLYIREHYAEDANREVILFDDVMLPDRHPIMILVSPSLRQSVEDQLKKSSIKFTVSSEDVQEILDDYQEFNEQQKNRYSSLPETKRKTITPGYFMPYDEIQSLLKNWSATAQVQANLFELGRSYEGRIISGIQINGDKTDLPVVWVDAGIDPRVWISPATAIYIANQILFEEKDVTLRKEYRWFIVPTINPDGYEYSRTVDRLWKKTRSKQEGGCYGVDMNHNFNISWAGPGSSSNPCSDRYRSEEPFSEREVKAVMDTIQSLVSEHNRDQLIYFSLQSYGQIIQSPWSGKIMRKPEDFDLLHTVGRVGRIAANSVPERSGKFQFGTAPDIKYPISGSLLDWVKDTLKLNWTYAIDLAPELDSDAFPLSPAVPPSFIYLIGRQTMETIVAMLDDIQQGPVVDLIQLYGINNSNGELVKEKPTVSDGGLRNEEPVKVETKRNEL